MIAKPLSPETIDDYISLYTPDVQAILQRIRAIVHKHAPQAQELISYQMPAFKLNGILIYFAAFKQHIGLYPPVRGSAELLAAVAPYAGPKGNLKFPLNQTIPYDLIERIVIERVRALSK